MPTSENCTINMARKVSSKEEGAVISLLTIYFQCSLEERDVEDHKGLSEERIPPIPSKYHLKIFTTEKHLVLPLTATSYARSAKAGEVSLGARELAASVVVAEFEYSFDKLVLAWFSKCSPTAGLAQGKERLWRRRTNARAARGKKFTRTEKYLMFWLKKACEAVKRFALVASPMKPLILFLATLSLPLKKIRTRFSNAKVLI